MTSVVQQHKLSARSAALKRADSLSHNIHSVRDCVCVCVSEVIKSSEVSNRIIHSFTGVLVFTEVNKQLITFTTIQQLFVSVYILSGWIAKIYY